MNTSNRVEAFIKLAAVSSGDEFASIESMPANLRDIINKKRAAAKEVQLEEVAEQIVSLLQEAQTCKEEQVAAIRRARAVEAASKKKLEAVDRAIAYGNETMNYLPLLRAINLPVSQNRPGSNVTEESFLVPSSWSPKQLEAAD